MRLASASEYEPCARIANRYGKDWVHRIYVCRTGPDDYIRYRLEFSEPTTVEVP